MSFSFSIPPELEKQLEKISNIDVIAPKMLEAAAPIIVKAIKARTPAKSGDLKNSVKASEPTLSKRGSWMCNIYFDGYEKRKLKSGKIVKTPNAVKAATLEFGRNTKEIAPTDFVSNAIKDSAEEVAAAMQNVFETEAKSI